VPTVARAPKRNSVPSKDRDPNSQSVPSKYRDPKIGSVPNAKETRNEIAPERQWERAMRADVEKFLANKTSSRKSRLIFALDATGSREPTWDMACGLQSEMFREVESVGALLDVQLVFYRGAAPYDGECSASRWTEPSQLAVLMRKIKCRAGPTQIGKILTHVTREAEDAGIAAMVFVGDAMEENGDVLIVQAYKMKVPAFMFQEGDEPTVERVFKGIASASNGAYARFNAGAAHTLGELLRAVVAFVTGGIEALEHRKDDGAVKLLGQLKKSSS